MAASVLSTYRRMSRWPAGRWLFSRAVCLRAPYFATIAPRFIVLEPGRCEVEIRDRRRVHNHLGTVHAIALCNLAELSAGMMTEASLPSTMRWIPKGMTVEYLKKARGTMHAIATPDTAIVEAPGGYELPVTVSVRDPQDDEVFRARIAMWISPRSRG
jgi:acyl-coenzyme A thioesterase PaaI-like protein